MSERTGDHRTWPLATTLTLSFGSLTLAAVGFVLLLAFTSGSTTARDLIADQAVQLVSTISRRIKSHLRAARDHAEFMERLRKAFGRWCLMSEHDRPRGFVGMVRPGLGGLLYHPMQLGQRSGDDHARGLPSIAFFVVNVPHLTVSLKAGDRCAGEHVDALEPAGDGVRAVNEAVSIASDGTAFVSFHLGPRFHPGRPRMKMCGAVGDDHVVEAAP